MRILLLSDWMSNRGGAEAYIVSLRNGLRDSGEDVRLLTCGSTSEATIHSDERAFGTDLMVAQAFLQVVNPFVVSRAKEMVRSFKPDIALVSQFAYHMSPAVFDALDPTPVVVSMMDYKAICPLGTRLLPDGSLCSNLPGAICRTGGCVGSLHWARDQVRYRRIRKGLSNAQRVICPSEWARSQLHASGIVADTIPLGTAVPAGFRRSPAETPLFAYCGRLSREKGVAVLIAALARVRAALPDVRLRILGDGPLRRELEALASALGVADAVEFLGWVNGDDMDGALADVWAVVAPSLWAEPFGLAAIESVVRGIPVIASDSGGFRDTVEDGVNGILFPSGNVAALAERMVSVASGSSRPGIRLSPDVIERASAKYSIVVHTAAVRQLLSEVVRSTEMESVR